MKSSRPTENVEGARIRYKLPSLEHLTQKEKGRYWTSLQETEDVLAQISKLQKDRKDEVGDIQKPLSSEDLEDLQLWMEEFSDSRLTLSRWSDAVEKAEWELHCVYTKYMLEADIPIQKYNFSEVLADFEDLGVEEAE